jgi:ABC-type multidrug transport system fused ATPase/permease subunit
MDHPCHKCGHSIEDGKAFCSQCSAPQIRVATAEDAMPVDGGTLSSGSLPDFSKGLANTKELLHPPTLRYGIAWSLGIRVCAVAALIAIALMSFRLMPPLLALFGSGIVAVTFYNRRNPGPKLNARSGAQLGAAAGLIFSAISAVFFAIFVAVYQAGGDIRRDLLDQLQQFASRSNDPQVQATLDLIKTPDGISRIIAGMLGFFVVSIVAASIAGALTGFFFARRDRP